MQSDTQVNKNQIKITYNEYIKVQKVKYNHLSILYVWDTSPYFLDNMSFGIIYHALLGHEIFEKYFLQLYMKR